jgi:hypothetical protein
MMAGVPEAGKEDAAGPELSSAEIDEWLDIFGNKS